MQYLYRQYGEQIYNAGFLAQTEQEITAWCEAQGIALNNKNKTKLLDVKTWEKAAALFQTASTLLEHFGEQQFDDFNQFKQAVECRLKAEKSPFCHREKGRFQCRKLVRRKFSQSDCQNTQAQTKRIGRPLPTLPMPSRRAGRLWLLRHRQSRRIYPI